MTKTFWMRFLALISLFAMTGCESDSNSDDTGLAVPLADQTVSIPAYATNQTGVLTAPGDGTLKAHITSAVNSTLRANFFRIADTNALPSVQGSDFDISTGTTSGATWRVQVYNPSGVSIDTTIHVDFIP